MRKINIALSVSQESNGTLSVNENYIRAIEESGGLPSILRPCMDNDYFKHIIKRYDGFLFCGGGDIDPKYYGEEKNEFIKNVCSLRDRFEEKLFMHALSAKKPILGICRGSQVINVFLGGSLHRHIDGHVQQEKRNTATHSVIIKQNTLLGNIIGIGEIKVNSFHHQAIKRLATGAEINALSHDGYIEAFHYRDHPFLLCVQWHPEACFEDHKSKLIFRSFIRVSEQMI